VYECPEKVDDEYRNPTAKLLDEFLVDNTELESLTARLSEFNLFRVLKIDKAEIRHSNVLAWLLTQVRPWIGRYLCTKVSFSFADGEHTLQVSLTPAKVELMPLDDVEVTRRYTTSIFSSPALLGNVLIDRK